MEKENKKKPGELHKKLVYVRIRSSYLYKILLYFFGSHSFHIWSSSLYPTPADLSGADLNSTRHGGDYHFTIHRHSSLSPFPLQAFAVRSLPQSHTQPLPPSPRFNCNAFPEFHNPFRLTLVLWKTKKKLPNSLIQPLNG